MTDTPAVPATNPDFVPVISPDNQAGYIPVAKLKDALSKGFTVPNSPQVDLGANPNMLAQELGRISQTYKAQGTTIPTASEEHKADQVFGPETDGEKTLAMMAPDGSKVNVPLTQRLEALRSGFTFQDKNFQALFQAQVEAHKEGSALGSFFQAAGKTGTFGIANKVHSLINLESEDASNEQRAFHLAAEHLFDTKHETAQKAGAIAGVAGQLAATAGGGMFGEVAAGNKLAGAIEGAQALRSSPLVAKALAGLAEGAVLNAPQALAQGLIDHDVQGAAESLALGAGLGSLFRAVPAALNLARRLPTAEEAAGKALGSMGLEEGAKALPQEQKAPFLETLMEHGVSGKSTPEQVENTLKDLASGSHLDSFYAKVKEPLATGPLAVKIDSLAEHASPAIAEEVTRLSQSLEKAAPDGLITAKQLQTYAADVGRQINWKVADEVNNIRIQAQSEALAALGKMTQEGLSSGAIGTDAKVLGQWAHGQAIAEQAQNMLQTFNKDVALGNLNPSDSLVMRGLKMGLGAGAGTVAGHAASAVLGPVAGAGIGYTVGKYAKGQASHFIESYLENSPNSWLKTNKTSQAINSYLVLDALHKNQQTINQVGSFLRNIGEKAPSMYLAEKDPIKGILGSEANGLSKAQQFQRLSDRVGTLAGNPNLQSSHLDSLTQEMAGAHPELAKQLTQDFSNKIQLMNQILHQGNTSQPAPFQKSEKYQPSAAELHDIESQLKIVQNPYALLGGLKDGTVTAKQVAVAAQLNPTVLGQMRQELAKEAYSGKADLSYQQRLSASIVMGQAMDQSLKDMSKLQGVYQGTPSGAGPAPAMPGGGGSKGHKGHASGLSQLPGTQGTLGQRLSAGK